MSPIEATGSDVEIDVVICAYTLDRWDQLVAAVRSVEAQRHPAARLIVVIDHNEELLARSSAEFTGHTVLPNAHKQGLSGARNTGIAEASADVVAFLDDDAAAHVDWLAATAASLADDSVGGVGGRVLPDWETAQPGWFPDEFLWVVGCSYVGLPEVETEIRNPIGANMAFRRTLMTDVGGFREEVGRVGAVPVGCEETELSIQVRRQGHRIVYSPDALVSHHVPADRAGWHYFWTRCLNEGRSKAAVARLTGADEALESERHYASRTLPAGAARRLRRLGTGPRRLDGLLGAAAIVIGLVVTGVGYVEGTIRRNRAIT
ncbi:glycosyltransferase [Actinospongicola halichondriae]|uniref:glycosyltransferase n=1 Tax=Actinospongicola halichondriae TaxID=3236844 RepID=UPI003D4C0626